MKEYHFENDTHDFDQTIRLDAINEELKRREATEEDELGDANAFLDAFESEKFDTPRGDWAEPPVPPRPAAVEEDAEDAEPKGLSKRMVTLLAAVGVLACILGFSLVRCGFSPLGGAVAEGQASPMLVEEVLSEEELLVYDIAAEKRRTLTITAETSVTDAAGRTVAHGGIAMGDLAMMRMDRDGETVLAVDYSDPALQEREVTGLAADTGKRLLAGEDDSFVYEKETLFLYGGEEIDPQEIEPCDVLLLKGYGDTVWVADVQEYHGYIVVENADNIKDGTLKLDEEEEIPLENGMRLAVKEGTHEITVSGTNIESRTDSLFVEAGEELSYDLSKAQEKVGVILINANVSDYKLYVNGTLTENPAVLPLGEYDLVILKNGYLEWSQKAVLDRDTLTINAELQQDLQYGTLTVTANCDGAWVSINGEAYGVAPMQVNLPYGVYQVLVEKDGYEAYRQTVTIQSAAASLYAELE